MITRSQSRWPVFTPLPIIGLGLLIAYRHAIPVTLFSANMAAVLLGICLVWIIPGVRNGLQQQVTFCSLIALVLMASSLGCADMQGVHRWVSLGSMRLNISMILMPLVLYNLSASLKKKKFFLAFILTVGVSIIHALQPDAAQAIAFSSGVLVLFIMTHGVPEPVRWMGILSTTGGALWAWQQPDSLPAVDCVERILHLALDDGMMGLLGIILVLVILWSPVFYLWIKKIRHENGEQLIIAFIFYSASTFLVTALGNYPVPLMGAGASSVLGWYLLLALCW